MAGNVGALFWIDPKEKVVAILLTHTSMRGPGVLGDFQAAAMQASTGRT
jgi:CubicO group peptidase (beta-lactamase class C family)